MALSDFKLIDAQSVTSLSELTSGMQANEMAKAEDVNAIFRQNSLIAIGLLNGLSLMGNTVPSGLKPETSSLSDMSLHLATALSVSLTIYNDNLIVKIGGSSSVNSSQIPLSDFNVGSAAIAMRLGIGNVGSEGQAMYLDNGVPTAANIFSNSNNFCQAKTLIKNMNGYTVPYRFNDISLSPYPSGEVKQFQNTDGTPITNILAIKEYLRIMTGHIRVPVYDEDQPSYSYLLCTDDDYANTMWRLQYDSTNHLLAFKVHDFPFFATKSSVQTVLDGLSTLGSNLTTQTNRINTLKRKQLSFSINTPLSVNDVISLSDSLANYDYIVVSYTVYTKTSDDEIINPNKKTLRFDNPYGRIGYSLQSDPNKLVLDGYNGTNLYNISIVFNYDAGTTHYDQFKVKSLIGWDLLSGSASTDFEVYIDGIDGYKYLDI